MARVRCESDSDDDLPDLNDVLSNFQRKLPLPTASREAATASRTSPRKNGDVPRETAASKSSTKSSTDSDFTAAPILKPGNLEFKTGQDRNCLPSQNSINGASSRLQLFAKDRTTLSIKVPSLSKSRTAPARSARQYKNRAPVEKQVETSEESEVEESIWCGSAASDDESDAEVRLRPRPLSPRKLQLRKKQVLDSDESELETTAKPLSKPRLNLSFPVLDTSSSEGGSVRSPNKTRLPKDVQSSDKENEGPAALRFSPPRLHKKPPEPISERPVTPPPTSPSKSRLVSPSKIRVRIPTPPGRASIDAFWDAENVNQWNDQYSPQKPLLSPRKNRFLTDSMKSPPSSPRKSQSPAKPSRNELEAKKDFANRKHQLATDFFNELDQRITDGKIQSLSAATGGVRLIWSKTLNSTAGRANWKRETSKSRQLDGTTTNVIKHHASIELAEKVIDDETRLINVIAHEFCHLANFMVSGIKDQPHGAQFKIWGRKVTAAFGSRGIEVTTKHSYAIDYKYVWACTNEFCGHEFKRHSKSIDPGRYRCGNCKGRLVQVKPVPRGGAAGKGEVKGYALFVKEHFKSVKEEMGPKRSHKDVMEAVGRRYREMKAQTEEGVKKGEKRDVEDMVKAFEIVVLDD